MTNQDVIGDNMLTDGVGVDKFMCDKNSDVITAFNEAEVAKPVETVEVSGRLSRVH